MANYMTTKKIPQTIETFFSQLKDVSDENKLKIFTAVVDMLRYSATLVSVGPVPIANLIAATRDFPWGRLDFYATGELLCDDGVAKKSLQANNVPDEAAAKVLLAAMPVFFELLEDGVLDSEPQIEQTSLLEHSIAYAAEQLKPAKPVVPIVQHKPEIFTHRHMARVYAPRPVTPELFDRLGVAYGLYTKAGENQIRAFRFDSSEDTYMFILESGEVVLEERTPDGTNVFEAYNRQEDFTRIPLTLLACTQLALSDDVFYRHLLPPALVEEFSSSSVSWFSGCFGGFKHPVRSVFLQPEDVQQLLTKPVDAVGKDDRLPTEKSLHFSMSKSSVAFSENLGVTLVAHHGKTGSVSVTSALTKSHATGDVVLMRHDYPRQHIAGFYLFPCQAGLINLAVRI